MIRLHRPLVLASASPRRSELLEAVGLSFRVHPSSVDETQGAGEPSRAYVSRLARAKAETIARRYAAGEEEATAVLGADTVVVVDERVLGKPASDADARSMLRTLSGRWHEVLTAVCVLVGGRAYEETVASEVQFRDLDEVEIDDYVATGEGHDKAGAYAIQGIGMTLVPQIRGSYTNIVGLPVVETLALLREAGVVERRRGSATAP